MKKTIIAFLTMGMTVAIIKAQQAIPVATLENADGTHLFTGSNGFVDAMEIADHGDVITLSEGSFTGCKITKSVSIYGSGYQKVLTDGSIANNTTIHFPTQIVTDLIIDIDSINGKPVSGLYIEGISANVYACDGLTNAEFAKCRFYDFNFWYKNENNDHPLHGYTRSEGIIFRQCRFANWLEPGNCQNMLVTNCIINMLGQTPKGVSLSIENCMIHKILVNCFATYRNSIIRTNAVPGEKGWFHSFSGIADTENNQSLSSFYHCVVGGGFTGGASSQASVYIVEENWAGNIFNTQLPGEEGHNHNKYSDENDYSLTPEAQSLYLGIDGKQVGIYGGSHNFNTILTHPHITYKDIASKTEDNKLKVNIKVEVIAE